MSERKGQISVDTADVFPIIKKWLYSEHDIFIRELVANSTDAITKRATLARTMNQEIPVGKINVLVNKSAKTIKIIDNGLGMTEEEVEKYIAKLAFSGAEEFVKKMEEQKAESNADIIGKFGLGFYSAFMVANKVEIDSLSMNEGAKPVHWTCEGETEYVFSDSEKKEVGTTITLHINSESEEFLSEFQLSQTLRKFCDFMPYTISVLDDEKKPEKPRKDDGSIDEEAVEVAPTPTVVNETNPIWKRDPSELKDEDYIRFFQQLYPAEGDPLFWIHLNVDHPFTLEGVLFFPKINPNRPFSEHNIKLYCRQVFVSDNVKNVIPDFLGLLKGVIDSTDIPLNVSRSSLQGDPNVKKISNYIVKKVADALKKLFKTDREKYETIWQDISTIVKYGCITDEKFDSVMRSFVLFKNSENKLVTLDEYRESIPKEYEEKMKDLFLYFDKDKSDWSLRSQLLTQGIHALETDDHIDPHFMQNVEMKKHNDQVVRFSSVDAEFGKLMTTENITEEDIKVKDLFLKFLGTENNESKEQNVPAVTKAGHEVEIEKIPNSTPAYFKVDEQTKRFNKMAQQFGNGHQGFPIKKTLVLNPANELIKNALKIHTSGKNEELVGKICHHVEDLATISSEGLKNEEKDGFVKRSQELISELTSLL